jgi:hypothetical protein
MPSFTKDAFATPFGRNVYLRSTQDIKTESYTVAAATVPATTIDGYTGQKVLQPGTVMAKATSGASSGKIGPFSAAATDGRQTLANVVGICNTFLPWQLMERDVEIAVVYEASVLQAKCIEYDASDEPVALTNTTAAGMVAQKTMDIKFR